MEVGDTVVEVDVGATMQEHAEDTLDEISPQFETKVGSEDTEAAVNVEQNCDTAEDCWIICLRQLS